MIMTNFRKLFSLPCRVHFFSSAGINARYIKLEAQHRSNFNGLLLTHSRCISTKKSIKDVHHETENKKQHSLFQINYVARNQTDNSQQLRGLLQPKPRVDFPSLIKKIQENPLNDKTIREHLHLMLTFFRTQRSSPNFATEMDSFVKSEEFEKLTQKIEQMLPMFEPKLLSLTFSVMHKYEIPSTSILMQKLHALVLDNINNFEIFNILQMYLSIKNKDEELLKPIKIAFLKYIDHLSLESLDFMGSMDTMMYFVANEDVPFTVRQKILEKILYSGMELKDLKPYMLVKLSFPLCSPEFQHFDSSFYLDALEKAISKNIQYFDLKALLENLINGLRKKTIHYRRNLFDCIAIAATAYSVSKASHIMNVLHRNGHVNYELADYVVKELIETDPTTLPQGMMEGIICNLAAIDYKNYSLNELDNNWSKLENYLKNYIQSGVVFKNIQTPLSLLILEIDEKELFNKALTSFMETIDTEIFPISIKRAALLYQYYHSVYSKPPENVSKNFLPLCMSKLKNLCESEWNEAIVKVFNGEENILRKCKTPYGTFISYVGILGPDQTPLNLSAYKKPENEDSDVFHSLVEIEKIKRPPGSTVFAFIESGQEPVKFRNISTLRPEARIIEKMHKHLGYKIFHFFLTQKKCSVEQRAEILQRLITRILDEPKEKTE